MSNNPSSSPTLLYTSSISHTEQRCRALLYNKKVVLTLFNILNQLQRLQNTEISIKIFSCFPLRQCHKYPRCNFYQILGLSVQKIGLRCHASCLAAMPAHWSSILLYVIVLKITLVVYRLPEKKKKKLGICSISYIALYSVVVFDIHLSRKKMHISSKGSLRV